MLALVAMVVGIILLFLPIKFIDPLSVYSYFVSFTYYFLLLQLAALLFFNIGEGDIRKFSEKNLDEIRTKLTSFENGDHKSKKIFVEEYLPVFSFIIDRFNELVGEDYLNLGPYVKNSHLYKNAFFTSAIDERPGLKRMVRGIKRMQNALKVRKQIKPIDFNGFIKGLLVMAGKEPKFSNIPESFDIPSFKKSLSTAKWPVVSILVTFAIGLVPVYFTLAYLPPGELPLEKASIFEDRKSVYVKPVLPDGDPLIGGGTGEYYFIVLNEYRESIHIKKVKIVGPNPITYTSANGGDTQILIRQNAKLEIKGVKIICPSKSIIIDRYESEVIVENLYVEYDLGEWREAITEGNFDEILISGLVEIQVTFDIMDE